MKLSNYERETILNFNEAEETASVYTHNKAIMHKLERYAQKQPDDCRLCRVSHDGQAAEFCIPKSWLHIHRPRKGTKLTAEQKEQRREQLANMRKG